MRGKIMHGALGCARYSRENMVIESIYQTGMIMVKYIHVPVKIDRDKSPLTSTPIYRQYQLRSFQSMDVHAGDSQPNRREQRDVNMPCRARGRADRALKTTRYQYVSLHRLYPYGTARYIWCITESRPTVLYRLHTFTTCISGQ